MSLSLLSACGGDDSTGGTYAPTDAGTDTTSTTEDSTDSSDETATESSEGGDGDSETTTESGGDGDGDTGGDGDGDTGGDGDTAGDGDAGDGDSTTTGGDGDGDGDPCMTVLCNGVCCEDTEECFDDQCLPICETGIRCGANDELCCDAGQVCVSDACETPGDPCGDNYDCDPGEFCEPTLNNCIGQDDDVACEVTPSAGVFDPVIEWDFTDDEIVATPLVADIDGDGVQEVIVNLTRVDYAGTGAIGWWRGEIAVLNGNTGAVELQIDHNPPNSHGSHGRSTPAVGDVNGDGLPDIVYAGRADENSGGSTYRHSIVHAVDHNGTLLWSSNDGPTGGYAPHDIEVSNGAPTLANFDSDDNAEVVIGATLIDHNGVVVWDAGDGGTYGSPASYSGGISAVADLNGDNQPEIISGRHAWSVSTSLNVTPYWEADLGNTAEDDGFPAVADLDQDGNPEVVIVANGMLHIRNGFTGNPWCAVGNCTTTPLTQPYPIEGGGRGGPPTIADFDGDGRPEIGIAGATRYAVYDIYRNGETVVYPGGNTAPNLGEVYTRWFNVSQDASSNSTGSSVFDFEGDGKAEVIYGDECYMRAYNGETGAIKFQIESTTGTVHEYPIVADVDQDGNSEILIVANSTEGDQNCPFANYQGVRQGVFVYGDSNDRWVPTRDVWTQHTYHVTDATSDGNVPATETNNWTPSLELNNFRQNVQGAGVFNAPDLQLGLSLGLGSCPDDIELIATVSNEGSLGVPAGVPVTFYEGTNGSGTYLGMAFTTIDLLPGASEQIVFTTPSPSSTTTYYSAVDDAENGDGVYIECDEDNNDDTSAGYCLTPG